MQSYHAFLSMLRNKDLREHIEKLPMGEVYNDREFLEARRNANLFQEALTNIFLIEETALKEFSLKYGFF